MSRGWRRTRNAISVIGALALLAHSSLVVSSCAGTPEAGSPRARLVRPPTVDADLELARRYAPIVYHATARRGGRQDLPCNVDFDGDLVGNNDWENFDLYEVTPTLLYAVLSTETHWFLTYHLFHPRDWASIPLGLQDTHENDGENLQVVVDRSTGRVVLLFTQAHYRGRIYANDRESFGDGHVKIRGGFRLADALGREDDDGTHACVFVESHGHGVYGATDSCAEIVLDGEHAYRFSAGTGLLLRPAREDEDVREPERTDSGVVAYQLESTTAKLWPRLRDGSLVGDGALLDGACPYRDDRVAIDLPRYYDGNRYSGPLGNDRGISPFAVDFGFSCGEVGALFFDPARRYTESIRVPNRWSTRYSSYPFSPLALR